ncbi:MAG: thiamine phosphate synthase [Acidobacteria bacterium]|nr:thiamine phosphate synthase [Acidobacteriota bacterium]
MPFSLPRFYPILDAAALSRAGLDPLETARALVGAGVEIVQFRWKGPYTCAAIETAEALEKIVHQVDARYVINDRADIALLAGADGVHVGQDDLPPEAVRRVIGDRLFLGYSTHNRAQLEAAAAEPIDYVALGPVFATASKENPDPRVGLEELARLAPSAGARPLVAIGGITLETAPAVLAAGAAACAVISDWMPRNGKLDSDWRQHLESWVRL